MIDAQKKAAKNRIPSDGKRTKIKTLSLLEAGPRDEASGIRGWHFKWGATGLCSLGYGLFYISHNSVENDGQQQSTVYKYKWIGNDQFAFTPVE